MYVNLLQVSASSCVMISYEEFPQEKLRIFILRENRHNGNGGAALIKKTIALMLNLSDL